jgi:hypothetical protein
VYFERPNTLCGGWVQTQTAQKGTRYVSDFMLELVSGLNSEAKNSSDAAEESRKTKDFLVRKDFFIN